MKMNNESIALLVPLYVLICLSTLRPALAEDSGEQAVDLETVVDVTSPDYSRQLNWIVKEGVSNQWCAINLSTAANLSAEHDEIAYLIVTDPSQPVLLSSRAIPADPWVSQELDYAGRLPLVAPKASIGTNVLLRPEDLSAKPISRGIFSKLNSPVGAR